MSLLGVVVTTLGAIIAALLTYLGVRYTSRSARAATAERNADEWNAAYRATAEKHLRWDLMIMNRLLRVEQTVGIEEPVPDPPPLFPSKPAPKE